jgi:hypothetical protein
MQAVTQLNNEYRRFSCCGLPPDYCNNDPGRAGFGAGGQLLKRNGLLSVMA